MYLFPIAVNLAFNDKNLFSRQQIKNVFSTTVPLSVQFVQLSCYETAKYVFKPPGNKLVEFLFKN